MIRFVAGLALGCVTPTMALAFTVFAVGLWLGARRGPDA